MNKESLKNFPIEPLMSNRYIIRVIGVEIPEYLFRSFKIFNNGEDLIFMTDFFETVQYSFNPNDFFNITGIKIEYLSPIGDVVKSLIFNIKEGNFEKEQSYSDDGLQINKLKYTIDKNSLYLI